MDLFDLTGIARPLYVGIWQCVGMIVGVYGIGYAIAATNPYRHWPIVLVGFLGKVFGPIGMAYNFIALPVGDPGRLPFSWTWINLTNDLVWLIPFAAILYQSFKSWNAPSRHALFDRSTEGDGASFEQANRRYRSQYDESIASLSEQAPVLVVFLRHSGCTFCREALQDLAEQREKIESNGNQIVLVHMGDNESSQSFFDSYGLGDVHRLSDPTCELYHAYDLKRGGVGQLFGASVFWRGFQAAILNRHGVGKLGGDGFQMPGAFLVHHQRVITAFRHENASSRPDYCRLAESSVDSAISGPESSLAAT
jgi:peroxiredoxin